MDPEIAFLLYFETRSPVMMLAASNLHQVPLRCDGLDDRGRMEVAVYSLMRGAAG